MDRGGTRRLRELKDMSRVIWNRERDAISESTVNIVGQYCSAQADTLNFIEPGRHEIAIFRGDERVWEGPITRLAYTREGVGVFSRDVMHYSYRTVMHAGYDSRHPLTETVVGRAYRIMMAELARKEALGYNLLDHIVEHHFPNEAETSTNTYPYQDTVFNHIDQLAAKAGMDYVTIGRAVHLIDTSRPLGMTRVVTENDFLGEMTVSVYGMELATAAFVTDQQGTYGSAGGNHAYYGEVEILSAPYNEEEDGSAPSAAIMATQAARNLDGRLPTPLQVRVPDNSSLNPNGVLKVTDLVPGVYVPLRATLQIRPVQQMQKIKSVKFTEEASGEKIEVTMYPASESDDVEV
jgi:hypothetical protein